MKKTIEKVVSESALMRTREQTQTQYIADVVKAASKSGGMNALENSYFWMIAKSQLYVVDIPTYLGAKEKALAEGFNEEDAIALAEQVVKTSQSSGSIMDLAAVQRGGTAMRLFLNFYSYFSATLNLTAEEYAKTDFKKPKDVGKFMWQMMMLYTIPAVLSEAVFMALRGEDDDEMEDLFTVEGMAKETALYAMGTLPFVRDLSGAMQGYSYKGPTGGRIFADMNRLAQQVNQGEVDVPLFKAGWSVVSILAPAPASQFFRTYDGIVAYEQGRAPITSVLVGPPRK